MTQKCSIYCFNVVFLNGHRKERSVIVCDICHWVLWNKRWHHLRNLTSKLNWKNLTKWVIMRSFKKLSLKFEPEMAFKHFFRISGQNLVFVHARRREDSDKNWVRTITCPSEHASTTENELGLHSNEFYLNFYQNPFKIVWNAYKPNFI